MPITAYRDGVPIISTDITAEQFDELRNGAPLQFRCGVRAIPRRSRAQFPHFYHQSLAECHFPHTNPETDEHRAIKSAIIRGARAAGWHAEEEYPNEDRKWIADVLVTNGTRRIAFEAQWSKQTDEDFRFRTNRYKDARLETVWFYRHAAPADVVRHGLIPVRKGRDGIVVVEDADGGSDLAVEDVVAAILTTGAWWKFERTAPILTAARWSALPCLSCRTTNVNALPGEKIQACTRCAHTASESFPASIRLALMAADGAGLERFVSMAQTTCGSCGHDIGAWAIDVAVAVASFSLVQKDEGTLAAHWCVPDCSITTYGDLVRALIDHGNRQVRRYAPTTTPRPVVQREIAEVRRRLEKGARTLAEEKKRAEFMASPAGDAWLKKKRREEAAERNKIIQRRLTESMKLATLQRESAAADVEQREADLAAAGRQTIRDAHEMTLQLRDAFKVDAGDGARLAVQFGRLERRCLCPDCEDFRSHLSAHTIKVLFSDS
jgi:hypothetical protein